MDIVLKIIMALVFWGMSIASFAFTDMLRKFWGNFMIANEETLRKVPVFGLFVREFIFWFEKGAGMMVVRLFGVVWLFIGILILFVL